MRSLIDVPALLRAAIATADPHCFSAHVPGKGYINRGTDPATRADFDRQYRRAAESEIENMTYAPGYAEPGYTQPTHGVLLANWNVFPSGVTDQLESAGYETEWLDEWISCDDCQRVFRTSPDSYCWRPAGQVFEADRECLCLCVDCLQDWAQANRPDDDDDQQVTL